MSGPQAAPSHPLLGVPVRVPTEAKFHMRNYVLTDGEHPPIVIALTLTAVRLIPTDCAATSSSPTGRPPVAGWSR